MPTEEEEDNLPALRRSFGFIVSPNFCLPHLRPTGRGPFSKIGEGAMAQSTQVVQCHPRGATTGGGGTDKYVFMHSCQVVLRTPVLS